MNMLTAIGTGYDTLPAQHAALTSARDDRDHCQALALDGCAAAADATYWNLHDAMVERICAVTGLSIEELREVIL